MSMSDYLENAVIQHFLKAGASVTQPTAIYAALHTANPTDAANAGTEVSGNGYARKAISFAAPAGGSSSNSGEVLFDAATASWGTITHVSLWNALTGGNMLYHGQLPAGGKAIGTGDQFRIPAGGYTVTND